MSSRLPEPYLLNKKNMAKAIGISVQAFDKWGIKPVDKIGRENFYLVSQVIDYAVNRATSENDDLEVIDQLKVEGLKESNRLKKEQATNYELKNELLKANSVPAEMATVVLSKIAAQIVSILDQIPGRIKQRLPELKTRDLDVVKKEIASCRNIASNCDQYADEFIDEFIADTSSSV